MSSKKRAIALPLPNVRHPANRHITVAISKASEHSHHSSYHSFITPSTPPVVASNSNVNKRSNNLAPSAFPEALPNAIDALILNEKLLKWFDSVKESRGMPWRVEQDVTTLSKTQLSQRGYEVWVSEVRPIDFVSLLYSVPTNSAGPTDHAATDASCNRD